MIGIEIALKAWGVAKQYYGQIACVLTVLFAGLFFRSQGALDACLSADTGPTTLTQVQYITVTAKCIGTAKVVYAQSSPCPDVTLDFDAMQDVAHWQSNAVTQTAKLAPSKPVEASNGLFLGVGYLGAPMAQIGAQIGAVQVYGMTTGAIHGGVAAVRVWSW